MREIKFRGQKEDTKEWVYGNLLRSERPVSGIPVWCEIHIPFANDISVSFHRVIPESVGQYAGLKDKNGKYIYEGDIVSWTRKRWVDLSDEEDGYVEVTDIGTMVYRHHGFWVDRESFGWEGESLWDWDQMEVIGNIYETPELLTSK